MICRKLHTTSHPRNLKFLARDGSNAQAIAKLKRSADASAVTLKAKKILTFKSSSDTPVPPLPVVRKPGTIQLAIPAKVHVPSLTSSEVLYFVEHFKSKEYVVESGNTVTSLEDEPELIPHEVLDVVESLRVALEINFGGKKCASKPKFTPPVTFRGFHVQASLF